MKCSMIIKHLQDDPIPFEITIIEDEIANIDVEFFEIDQISFKVEEPDHRYKYFLKIPLHNPKVRGYEEENREFKESNDGTIGIEDLGNPFHLINTNTEIKIFRVEKGNKEKEDIACFNCKIRPSKLLYSDFEEMITDIDNIHSGLIKSNKDWKIGIRQQKRYLLEKENNIFDKMKLIESLTREAIATVKKIIQRPISKPRLVSTPIQRIKANKPNNIVIKKTGQKGISIKNGGILSKNKMNILYNSSFIDGALITNVYLYIIELKMVFESIAKDIENKKWEDSDVKKYLDIIKSSIKQLDSKGKFIKLKYNLRPLKNKPNNPTWSESNNPYYSNLRQLLNRIKHTHHHTDITNFNNIPIKMISELYEYWLLLKIIHNLNGISGITVNNDIFQIVEEKNINKIKTPTIISGSIESGKYKYFEIVYEQEYHNQFYWISNYKKEKLRIKKDGNIKEKEFRKLKKNKEKFGLLRPIKKPREIYKNRTPDYTFRFFNKNHNMGEEYNPNVTIPKKLFIFDAKYSFKKDMRSTNTKLINNKSYDKIGKSENIVKHFWLFYPGINKKGEDKYSGEIEKIYSKKILYKNDKNEEYTNGIIALRPEYGDIKEGEYNVDDVLNIFLTKLFKIEGILK